MKSEQTKRLEVEDTSRGRLSSNCRDVDLELSRRLDALEARLGAADKRLAMVEENQRDGAELSLKSSWIPSGYYERALSRLPPGPAEKRAWRVEDIEVKDCRVRDQDSLRSGTLLAPEPPMTTPSEPTELDRLAKQILGVVDHLPCSMLNNATIQLCNLVLAEQRRRVAAEKCLRRIAACEFQTKANQIATEHLAAYDRERSEAEQAISELSKCSVSTAMDAANEREVLGEAVAVLAAEVRESRRLIQWDIAGGKSDYAEWWRLRELTDADPAAAAAIARSGGAGGAD